jgi:hypothetical protein
MGKVCWDVTLETLEVARSGQLTDLHFRVLKK